MATTTAASLPANSLVLDDIFHELTDEIQVDLNEFHLNQFYLSLNDELRTQTQSSAQEASTNVAITNDSIGFHQIPDYLQASSSTFQVAFFSELRCYYKPINFQDLQQLTFLTHRLSIIHLHQRFWQRLLQAGTGQLKQPSLSLFHTDLSLPFWSEIVRSVIISQELLSLHNQKQIDQQVYVHFVRNYLIQLETKAKQYQREYETIKQQRIPPIHKDTLDDKINRFVQKEGLRPMEYYFQMRMALLEYTYLDRTYQWKYLQEKPTEGQFLLAKRICSLTFEKEKAEQEMILFKFGVIYNRLPKLLDLLEISPPTLITTISDSTIRHQLFNEYITLIQRAKEDLGNVLRTASEAKKIQCEKKFNRETSEMWRNQHQLPSCEQLTSTMVKLIEQRQKTIIECLQRIYKLKDDFLLYVPRKTSIS